MKIVKTIAAAVLALAVLTVLSACNSGKKENAGPSAKGTGSVQEQYNSGSKTLVAFFSCTGNTKRAARIIADEVDGDLFEITPEKPYTDADLDWRDKNSRVSKEFGKGAGRSVPLGDAEVPGWDGYDTVFIGYHIWYGEAAFPVASFVSAKDFSGVNETFTKKISDWRSSFIKLIRISFD